MNIDTAIANNASRDPEARIPRVALYATRKKLEIPSYEEGFDTLYRVQIDDAGGFVIERMEEM